MKSFITLLYDWQSLVGSFLGPFLAVLLSGIAYLIGKAYEKAESEKEAMRKIEIATSYSLNSTINMQLKLQHFVAAARALADEIAAETNPRAFALQTINFPAVGTIYLDDDILKMPTKSYYIHNKLLWIHSGIKDVNNILLAFREDFARVVRMNEKMLDLMKENPNPPAQRESYVQNLNLFANEIQRFSDEDLTKGMTPLIQTKIYNDKLRKSWLSSKKTLWKNEGVKSWLIQKIFGFDEPKRNLSNVDRIDTVLAAEVAQAIEEMQTRLRAVYQET